MDKFFPLLARCPLFQGVEQDDLSALLTCLSARLKRYAKNESVLRLGDPAGPVGILCSGSMQVQKEDFTGNRTILAHLGEGDLFGEAFACTGWPSLPVSAVAVEPCEVLLIDYRKLITTCSNTCVFHGRLIENMMGVLAAKNIQLSQKIELLSKRSTREKLIAYLSMEAQAAGSRRFHIPFNRQELADYLCVERSAMSTELSKLKREGILDVDKNTFVIQYGEDGSAW